MPLITIPIGVPPQQIDMPEHVGEGKERRKMERSCKGALHLRPSSSKVITDDELAFLNSKKELKEIARRLIVVQVDVAKAKSLTKGEAKAQPKVEKKPEPWLDAKPMEMESEKKEDEKKSKKDKNK